MPSFRVTVVDMTAIVDTFREEVAAAVRSLLGEQRKTVTDLATVLHLSRATASERVNGGSAFTADEMEAVAKFFKLADVYTLLDIAESISKRMVLEAVAS